MSVFWSFVCLYLLAEKLKLSASSGTNTEAQKPELTLEDNSVPETLAGKSRGPRPTAPNSAGSEGVGAGGGCKSRAGDGGDGPEFSRAGSDTYLTASDDSSSLFDFDMQLTERPSFSLRQSSVGVMGGCQDRGEEVHRTKMEDSEELNKRFQLQNLDSSSSSSEPNTPSPVLTPALTPKRPNPPQDPRDKPASPKQPRLRTPAGTGLAKKHLSQPPISSEATHGQTRNALSMLRPFRPEETDPDHEQEVVMETCSDTPQVLPVSQAALPLPSSPKMSDSSAPPTPPLHRLPSWVRQCCTKYTTRSHVLLFSIFFPVDMLIWRFGEKPGCVNLISHNR